jgi:membrane-associated phospholipid phosphatase
MQRQSRNPVLVGLSVVQLALFSLLAWWVRKHPVLSTDVAISHTFQKRQKTFLEIISKLLSVIGSAGFTSIVALLISLAMWRTQRRSEALMTIGISMMSLLARRTLQQIIHRPRPCEPLVHVSKKKKKPSFPSGHVTASTTVWGWLIVLALLLLPGNRFRKGALTILPGLTILLSGPSRIYLGEHWASDVLGGYLLGSMWISAGLSLYLRLRKGIV